MDKCVICGRKASKEEFCDYHGTAHENVQKAYEHWKTALGVEWGEYLTLAYEEESTGRWAREVLEYLIQQNGS
jgi:hypothetical protein